MNLDNNQIYDQTGAAVSATVPGALYQQVKNRMKSTRDSLNADMSVANAYYAAATALFGTSLTTTQQSYLWYV